MADETYANHRQDVTSLFSMEAADNAEVVPTHAPRGPESLWSIAANPDMVEEVVGAGAEAPGSGAGPSRSASTPPPYVASSHDPAPGAGRGAGASAFVGAEGRAHRDRRTEPPADDDDAAWFSMGSARPAEPSSSAPPHSGFGVGSPTNGWPRSEVPPTPAGAPGAGGVFSAEPVERVEDVVDEDDGDEFYGEFADDDWSAPGPGGSVFSNGSNGSGGQVAANGAGHSGSSGAGGGGAGSGSQLNGGHRGASPFGGPVDPWTEWEDVHEDTVRRGTSPSGPTPGTGPPSSTGADPGTATRSGSFSDPQEPYRAERDPITAVAADQHGFDVAISRLRDDDQERARVPLAVCGALLEPGEQVVGVVTGQMLGRPAAVVATRERVLVVNDRRWEPIVDIYRIDASLLVRGRHDRHVAALSLADDERLSMVDGITEVELAIDLADAIRDPGGAGQGSGTAF